MTFTDTEIEKAINFGAEIEKGGVTADILNYGSYAEYFIRFILKKGKPKEEIKVVNPEHDDDCS
jgi:hypothetical protein